MGRTFITGDTHGNYDMDKIDTLDYLYGAELTREDVVIVAGDFGALWSSYQKSSEETVSERQLLDYWENRSWTTLAILGNHENYPAYDNYPVVEWCGGKCWQLRPHVYVACFGQYFTINDATYFTLNGARSHDISDGILERPKDNDQIALWWKIPYKMFRVKNESWWEEEVPDETLRAAATQNIADHDWKVDYVITHEAPASVKALMSYETEEYSQWLESLRGRLDYSHWYNGHLHHDVRLNEKHTILHNTFEEVGAANKEFGMYYDRPWYGTALE